LRVWKPLQPFLLVLAFFVLFTSYERATPDARERIPTGASGAARSYYFYGAYQRFNSDQKQRLLVSPLLELFLDRIVSALRITLPSFSNGAIEKLHGRAGMLVPVPARPIASLRDIFAKFGLSYRLWSPA
jgi:hypothetical protein